MSLSISFAVDDLMGKIFECVRIKRGRLSSYYDLIRTSWRIHKAHCIMLFVMVVFDLWRVLVTRSKLSRSGSGESTRQHGAPHALGSCETQLRPDLILPLRADNEYPSLRKGLKRTG